MQSKRVMVSGLVKKKWAVKTLFKMESGKEAGVDGISVESVKKGSDCVDDWLIRIFDVWIMVRYLRTGRKYVQYHGIKAIRTKVRVQITEV